MNGIGRRLDELVQIFDGPHATPVRRSAGPYFLNIASLDGGRLDLNKSDHVSNEDFAHWTRRVLPEEGDLLFSYETRLGEAALMPAEVEACLGRRMALMRPNRRLIDPRFLLYLYLSPAMQSLIATNAIHGATVPRIPVSRLGAWTLPIPPMAEQEAIASMLGALDDKIAANRATVHVGDGLAAAELTSAVRQEVEERVLEDSAELVIRGSAPRYTNCGDGVVVVNQKCVRNGRVYLKHARLTESGVVKNERLLVRFDSLVNSTGYGTLGRIAQWTLDARATVDSHITIVRWDADRVNPLVAGQVLIAMESEVELMGEGSTGQTELSRTQLQQLRLRLPSRRLQASLADRLYAISELSGSLLRESSKLAEMRDALLPHLMSGRLTVKAAESIVSDTV